MKTLSSLQKQLVAVPSADGLVRPRSHRRGFALIVTLTLMILLTVLAVGLLTLSTVSLRASGQADAVQVARANARMSLMLAIGDLQKQMGPDPRISVPADQRTAAADGGKSSAAAGRSYWTGVYRAWPSTVTTRPAPEFLSWLVSGQSANVSNVATVDTPPSSADDIELVGTGTVGQLDLARVSAPALRVGKTQGNGARLAWWVGDQGIKSALATQPAATDASLATRRMNLQGAPRNAVELASISNGKPFAALAADDPRINQVTDWNQSAFLASDPQAPRGLFHDLAPFSTGLLTNVTAGGFRKDLSLQLERPANNPPTTALYTVGGENGINLQELWAYYNLYKGVKTSGSANYTTSGRVNSGSPFLEVAASPADCVNDDNFYFKQPVIISYQLVLSFKTLPVIPTGGTVAVNRLHVVADPVLTFWNPLDVPVVVPAGQLFTVKYWQIPYDLFISKNGTAPQRYPLAAIFSDATATNTGDANFISLQVGALQQMAFKPGEVIKMSQSGSTIAKSALPNRHKLGGKAGFNFGSGVAMPVRDQADRFVDLAPADSITYTAQPNNLTAGKTSSDGNSPTGANQHTRHFSLTHHDYYVGEDRGSSSISLGIGGMFIDWDFGNRRLQAGEDRGQNAPGIAGTKPSASRLYANQFPDIFKPLLAGDGRSISSAEVEANKAPFMMVSYHAKTESGSDLGTRFLSRFNPKALHVDFYDLTRQERDMLPYEFSIEPLVSWKNRSLEVSTNGGAYYGGGLNAEFGSGFVTTHSVPREPIVSLAAFQHSFANGFVIHKPFYGYGAHNTREPMLPQISHAIGNSMASPVIPQEKTDTTLSGGRPAADHSYLANRALWDDYFLSGIAPQVTGTYTKSRDQKTVATDFFKRDGSVKLPVARYLPDLRGQDPAKIISTYFSGVTPSDAATREIASLLRVDGLFNVNSTSIEAWKCLLGSLKNRPIVVRDETGAETIDPADGNTPVSSLTPLKGIIATGDADSKNANQWVGRRTLTDDEIDGLARAIVKEVRKRGPFLSLADFVNRRVGKDKDLARAGAIQSALDSTDNRINQAYNTSRSVPNTTSSRFTFPEAERGPMAYGSPGVVKQADILTPIAPVLSARSDSFIIRAYGESVDGNGKVIARAWCEATVERSSSFVDPTDAPEKAYTTINSLNKFYGRRFNIVAFRWLNPSEV
jgi:hypothetical protein